jgi:anti-anti-sigma factor
LGPLREEADGGSVMESDLTMFGSAQRDDRPVVVKLSGELDVRYRRTLEDTLRDHLASGRPTLVDLSEVTFMDSRCLRELAIHYQLGAGRVALCDPSREVEVSVAACDLEEWLDFVYTTCSCHPPRRAAESVFHEAAIRPKKGMRPCAHHTRR